MMKVWVLCKKRQPKSYQVRRFHEEAHVLGLDLEHVVVEDFEIVEPLDKPGKVWHKGHYVDIPDVLITRVTGMSYFAYSFVRLMQRMGVVVMNSANSIELAEDKLRTIQVLVAEGLPIPTSILCKFPVDIDFISQKLGFPVIMKTVLGAKGEGVLLFENHTQLKDVTTLLQSSTDGKTNLIFQEYISDSYGKDIRVVVVGNKAIGAVMRKGAEGQFKANVSAGGTASLYQLDSELADLAVEATQALGLSISGVDFLFNKGSFVIGEVNSSPSFSGFEQDARVNVAREILLYALSLASKKSHQ